LNESKLNVIHFPRWFPNKNDSTSGIFVLNQILSTQAFANNYVVFADFFNEANHEEHYAENNIRFSKKYINQNITSIKFFDVFLKNIALLMFQIQCFYKYKNTFGKPDLMHVHILTRVAIIPFLISFFYNIPYVISEHWSRYLPEDNSFKGYAKIFITRLIVKRAKFVMPVSDNLRKGMLRFELNGNYQIIPNVVDTDVFQLRTKMQNEFSNIIFVGSLCDETKNISAIIHTFYEVVKVNKNTRLNIFGDGSDKIKFQNLVEKLGLQNNVNFGGKITQTQLAEAFCKHDFLILFSHYETFGCVLAEAMSCGLPVIASNVGSVAEIVHEQNGILVAKNDEKALLEAILKMQNAHLSFNKERLHNYIQRKFSPKAVSEKLEKVYFSAVNNV